MKSDLLTNLFSESFKEAKRRLGKAVEFSDLNTASEADDNMYGRGKRKKRSCQVYSPAEDSSSEQESSESSVTTTIVKHFHLSLKILLRGSLSHVRKFIPIELQHCFIIFLISSVTV